MLIKPKKMGSEGKITRDVIENAMGLLATDVDKHLANMPVTIGQAFTIGKTVAISALQEINEKTKIFDKIGGVILDLGLKFQDAVPGIINFISSIDAEQMKIFAGVIAGAVTPAIVAMGFALGRALAVLGPFMLAGGLIVQYWEPIKEFLKGIGLDFDNLGSTIDSFKILVLQILATLGLEFETFSQASNFMKIKVLESWGFIKDGIQAVVNFFISDILPIAQEFFDAFVSIISFFKDIWNENWLGIQEIVNFTWEAIKILITTAWEIVKNTILFGLNVLQGDWSNAWINIKNILSAVWEGIKNIISVSLTFLHELIGAGLGLISDNWEAVWLAIPDVVISAFDSVMETVRAAVDWVVQKINSLLSALKSAKDAVSNTFSSAGNAISSGWNNASNYVSSIDLNPFANGGIMTNSGVLDLPLKKYANGGIARSPQLALFGEAGPEAYVPLPDGRTIPVTVTSLGEKGGLASGGRTSQTIVNNVYLKVEGNVQTERNLVDAVSESIANLVGVNHLVHA